MNQWVSMLAELPTLGQRLIARSGRISLPRNADAAVRLQRLRQALCHAATVRVTYAALEPAEQQALQHLRTLRGGIRPGELTRRYGAIRSWRELAADPRPRSIAECLVLHGWLLLRPPRPNNPARYLLPPELRRWLPHPLQLDQRGPAPRAPLPPALHAAHVILLACAEAPLPLRRNGQLRVSAVRLLAPRLAPLADAEVLALCRFLLPVLNNLGLLAPHGAAAVLAPAGARFLGLAPAEQLKRLRAAWVRAPQPDAWASPLLVEQHGMDWPLFRRRLWAWSAALPSRCLIEPSGMYAALAAAFGPLANAQTHGFRRVDRVPWQPRRAAAIWDAALRGPLTWLGAIGWDDTASNCFATNDLAGGGTDATSCVSTSPSCVSAAACPWRYGAAGELHIPHTALDSGVLTVLPFVEWRAADAEHTTYEISRQRLNTAAAAGHSLATLETLLERHAGSIPDHWRATLPTEVDSVRVVHGAVVFTNNPAVLARATRQRSVRRYLTARLAPGIALADPARVPALTRTLERHDLAVTVRGNPSAAPPTDFTPAECALLLAALGALSANSPAAVPREAVEALEDRLRTALPHPLRVADTATRADEQLPSARPPAPTQHTEPLSNRSADAATAASVETPAAPSQAEQLAALRQSIRRRETLRVRYRNADGAPSQRDIRPLWLEEHAGQWYLGAYCALRQDERTFRVDRMELIEVLGRRARHGPGYGRRKRMEWPLPAHGRSRANKRASHPSLPFGLPDAPPGSPLVRIWLVEES
jgi:hypothetical protein